MSAEDFNEVKIMDQKAKECHRDNIYCENTYLSPFLPIEAPKLHFQCKVGENAILWLPWVKMVRNICFHN